MTESPWNQIFVVLVFLLIKYNKKNQWAGIREEQQVHVPEFELLG